MLKWGSYLTNADSGVIIVLTLKDYQQVYQSDVILIDHLISSELLNPARINNWDTSAIKIRKQTLWLGSLNAR